MPTDKPAFAGTLILIPWHTGDLRDVTRHALDEVARIEHLLVEDTNIAAQLFNDHGIDCTSKTFTSIGFDPDPMLLERCFDDLHQRDVGMLSSSGVPCFIDPGAWLVRDLRARGVSVRALPGPSALTTVLSLSGVEWASDAGVFTFCFFPSRRGPRLDPILDRTGEPIVVFLALETFAEFIDNVASRYPTRSMTAFFDLTKSTCARPDVTETMTVSEWRHRGPAIAHGSEDVSVIVHPLPVRGKRAAPP